MWIISKSAISHFNLEQLYLRRPRRHYLACLNYSWFEVLFAIYDLFLQSSWCRCRKEWKGPWRVDEPTLHSSLSYQVLLYDFGFEKVLHIVEAWFCTLALVTSYELWLSYLYRKTVELSSFDTLSSRRSILRAFQAWNSNKYISDWSKCCTNLLLIAKSHVMKSAVYYVAISFALI